MEPYVSNYRQTGSGKSIQLWTLQIRGRRLLIHGPFIYYAATVAIKQDVRQAPADHSVQLEDVAEVQS
jgi:hypothetical protein